MKIPAIALAAFVFAATANAQFTSATAPVNNPGGGFTGGCPYDDGSTENALGLTAGGEMAWLQFQTCGGNSTSTIETAYGTLMFPGSVTNGNQSKLAVYSDSAADNDPTTGMTLLASAATTVTNGDTDILNSNALVAVSPNNNLWALASADQIAGEFPGPMDQNDSGPETWVVGNTTGPGTLNLNLNSNNVPPLQMSGIGFAARWLLRLGAGGGEIGTNICDGDGSGTACPCGNNNDGSVDPSGCANGTFAAGCSLRATASSLNASGAIAGQPGLFFQGDSSLNGGNGVVFGDGLRCCGTNVIRLGVVVPDANGDASLAFPPVTGKCYQYWYRDPNGSPCGAGFNLSNAVEI